jgi:hypothetical protein
MSQVEFNDFCNAHRADGYTEFLEKAWTPNLQLELHQHNFAVKARVVAGEMWLSHGGQDLHLGAGAEFALEVNVPHTERYGEQGALVWIARRYN